MFPLFFLTPFYRVKPFLLCTSVCLAVGGTKNNPLKQRFHKKPSVGKGPVCPDAVPAESCETGPVILAALAPYLSNKRGRFRGADRKDTGFHGPREREGKTTRRGILTICIQGKQKRNCKPNFASPAGFLRVEVRPSWDFSAPSIPSPPQCGKTRRPITRDFPAVSTAGMDFIARRRLWHSVYRSAHAIFPMKE